MMSRKKLALAGASRRCCYGFAKPLLENYRDCYEIVGIYDVHLGKMKGFSEVLGVEIPCFTDFDQMLDTTKPDTVFVTSMDSTHAEYIVKSLERDLNCISEKPLCVNAEQCRQILKARQKHPDPVAITTHNCRYRPDFSKVKELIDAGEIGQISSVNYLHTLGRKHGASYFRRWNRRKAFSGGLLVHKSSHHFDLINWFVGSRPTKVTAHGGLVSFGPKASPFRGERCGTCEHADQCQYRLKYDPGEMVHTLFFKHNEKGEEYTPDLCVFSPEIDSEDHATVAYDYENGAQVSYNLCGRCVYAGWRIGLEGSEGRIEIDFAQTPGDVDHDIAFGGDRQDKDDIRIIRPNGVVEKVVVEQAEGGHGGSDPKLFQDLFVNETPSAQMATLDDGIQAVLIGAAANMSIANGESIENAQALLKG